MRPPKASIALERRSRRLSCGHVAGHDDRLAAALLDLGRHGLDRGDVAPDQREPAALRRRTQAHGRAHPLGGAGDDHDAPFKSQIHVCCFPELWWMEWTRSHHRAPDSLSSSSC